MDAYNFPAQKTFTNLIGTELPIQNQLVQLVNILAETPQVHLPKRWVVFEATAPRYESPVIVKLRFKLDPSGISPRDLDAMRSINLRRWTDECKALRECQGSGATPEFIASAELTQEDRHPWPGGYMRVIIMSKVPGKDVVELGNELTDDERRIIGAQLLETLEYVGILFHVALHVYMRLRNWNFAFPQTQSIFYDRQTKKMSLVGLSQTGPDDPPEDGPPLTRDSIDVRAFCFRF
ncbi:hypothetical protein BJX70DRAFT_396168 [Aspergillus crustosus]